MQPLAQGDLWGAIRLAASVGRRFPLPPDAAVDRDDMTQEAILGGLLAYRSYEAGALSFSSYVIRKARQRCIQIRRHYDSRGTRPDFSCASPAWRKRPLALSELKECEQPSVSGSCAMETAFLAAALGTLDPVQARIVSLRYLGGYSLAEICRITRLSRPQVLWRLAKAKAALREVLRAGP